MKTVTKFITITFIGLLLVPAIALSQSSAASPSAASEASTTAHTATTDKMANLKARADKEIDRRITELNIILNKINGFQKLSDSDKSAMTQSVQTEITNLTNLKTKIDAD
ncbi:hypothetical protein HY065_03105, partial [Candidatus Berkelbacteria bacterium]|nr:hypothetical protein [Candidatus Berkelbacteria bacterium]